MNYTIKRLDSTEITPMKELNALYADAFESAEDYAHKLPSDEYLATFLDDKNHIALVALADGKVVGGGVAYVLTKFEQERKEVYLYDLAVSREHQRNGVGRLLIEELKKISHEAGAYVMYLQADEGDDAIKFYESLNPYENEKTRSIDYLT